MPADLSMTLALSYFHVMSGIMAPQQAALPSGNRELLKFFKVLKFLGKGSYGSVYKVKRISDEKIYAVKETDVKGMSQAEREEAVNEIRLLASVKHPNIVEYNEAFLDGNRLCIVMEYASEGDFSGVIKKQQAQRRPFEEQEIWNYFIQIARGIGALHDMKVLHRDIKPGNIMVADGKRLTIGDLGIAKLLKSSMAKTQIGTPHYMPPEVWKSRPYAFPSDVWALGCILYEMCTFTVPFEARSMSELRYKILRGRYPPISRQYSLDLTNMVGRLLDMTPEGRPTVKAILSMDIVKQWEQKLRMAAVAQVPVMNQMLQTIQVPRNLNQLKDKFPTPNYASEEKENQPAFHEVGRGLPAIREAAPRAPSREASRAPVPISRGGAYGAEYYRPAVVPPSIAPPSDAGRGVRGPSPRGDPRHPAPPPQRYIPQQHPDYARGHSPAVPGRLPPIPGAHGVLHGHPAADRVGQPPSRVPSAGPRNPRAPSVYEALRNKIAPPPRPQYGAPPVSRVGSQAGSVASNAQYGQPAPYPPPYMNRPGAPPFAQYPFNQPYYRQAPPPPYPMSRNPYAQPSAQRHRPVYHPREFY